MKKTDNFLKLIKHYLFCRKEFNVEKYCKNFGYELCVFSDKTFNRTFHIRFDKLNSK